MWDILAHLCNMSRLYVLVPLAFLGQGLVNVYDNLGPLRSSIIFQLRLDNISPKMNFWWGSTQNRIEVRSHTGTSSTDLRMDWSMKGELRKLSAVCVN